MATNVTPQQAILGQKKLAVSNAVTDADTGDTVVVVEIPANSFIPAYGVTLHVVTAFAGGTPLLDVGDDDDPDGWVDQTENTATAAGAYTGTASALAVTGKLYTAANHINVVVSVSATAGCAYVTVEYYDVKDVSFAAV